MELCKLGITYKKTVFSDPGTNDTVLIPLIFVLLIECLLYIQVQDPVFETLI